VGVDTNADHIDSQFLKGYHRSRMPSVTSTKMVVPAGFEPTALVIYGMLE